MGKQELYIYRYSRDKLRIRNKLKRWTNLYLQCEMTHYRNRKTWMCNLLFQGGNPCAFPNPSICFFLAPPNRSQISILMDAEQVENSEMTIVHSLKSYSLTLLSWLISFIFFHFWTCPVGRIWIIATHYIPFGWLWVPFTACTIFPIQKASAAIWTIDHVLQY